MQYDLKSVIDRFENGEELSFLFFWGHTSDSVKVSAACLSQWYPSPFAYRQKIYRTAEHWMMAEKARLFSDLETRDQILACHTPKEAKELGRKVHNFDINTWKAHRSSIVKNGNYLKFGQNPALKEFLLATHPRILVEASPYDRIWGIGKKVGMPGLRNPNNWTGENLLGFALMEVRDKLMSQN